MSVQVYNKAIPSNPRSKNYPAGDTVMFPGSGGSSSGSSGMDAGLKQAIHVNSPQAGNILSGSILAQGMGYEQIFRAMLYKPTPATIVGRLSTSNDVEFGTSKGAITYTATRNDNGAMIKAYYDNDETKSIKFSEEVNGAQTATLKLTGIHTINETYTTTVVYAANDDVDISEVALTNNISVNVRRKWFAGICDIIPSTSSDVRSLGSSGIYSGVGTYKLPVGQWRTVAICIPEGSVKEISIASSYGNFVDNIKVCTGPIPISVEGANGSEAISYKMWVIQTQGLNDPDSLTFKTT